MISWRIRLGLAFILLGLFLLGLSHLIANLPHRHYSIQTRAYSSTLLGSLSINYRTFSLRPMPAIPPKAPEKMQMQRLCKKLLRPISEGLNP